MPTLMSGLKVVDLTQGYEGYCGMALAEFGASVIKVEPMDGDYSRQWGPPFLGQDSAAFLGVNRGKRSIALAWQEKQEARQILQRLILQADVLVSNLYPDEAESAHLDYKALETSHPTLIYCSITPYGDEGPHRNRRGTELEVQGFTAQWRLIGEHGQPPIRVGVPIAAVNATVFAVQGITGALIHRIRTGQGQKVSIAEMGAITSMRNITWAAESEPDDWIGHTTEPYRPPSRGYKTKDLNILWGFIGDEEAQAKFLDELGLGHLKDAVKNVSGRWSPEMMAQWNEATKNRTAREVLEMVWKLEGSATPYETFESLSKEPQALIMNMVQEYQHPTAGAVKTTGIPWEYSETPLSVGTPPLLGQHTVEVLRELGFSETDVSRLIKEGVARSFTLIR